MMKRIYIWLKRPLVLIALFLLIIFLFKRMNLFKGLFTSQPLLIENTPLVIKEIRTIAELNTATLYEEIVVDSSAPSSIPFATRREIVLVIKGKVTAGINLRLLEDKDIIVNDDSISIKLPPSEIREAIINPSDIETFYEFGRWKNEEIIQLKLTARSRLLQAAEQKGLRNKANIKAKSVMENFLKAAGFRKVNVSTKLL